MWFKALLGAEDAVWWQRNERRVTEKLGKVCVCCLLPKGNPNQKHSRVVIAPVLQTNGWESDKLPPTLGALKQRMLRVHVQARVWGQVSKALPRKFPRSIAKWLRQGRQWPAEADHHWCSTSTQGHHQDGEMPVPVQGRLLVNELTVH